MERPRTYRRFTYRTKEDGDADAGYDFTVIAHRGASAYYPENTLIAFEVAIAQNADMVELDVQLTSDGEVVVFHDKTLSRCTDGRGVLGGYSLRQLKALDAGGWFDEKYRGEQIPTLTEVLNLCRGIIAVNVEIKTEAVTDQVAGGIEEKCLKLVENARMTDHVVFSSFDPRAVRHLKQIDQRIPVAILYEKKYYGSQSPPEIVASLKADAFNCSYRALRKKWIDDLKKDNVAINVYTVNDEKNMRRMLEIGVNGIFTNYPDVLRKVLEDSSWKMRTGNP